MKKYIIASLALLFLTACEYKEDPVFDQNPKERILSSLQNTRKLLEGHDGYWLLTYYPEDYQEGFWVYPYLSTLFPSTINFPKYHRSLGGYNFILKFSEGKVTASSEVVPTNREETTYYSYNISEFPILSFNTKGDIIHHFFSSTTNYHDARGGEVDFFIDKVEKETFTLRGKRNGNIMTLSKLTTDRETFLNKIRENRDKLLGKGLSPISIGGTQVKLELFPTTRQIAFLYENDTKYQQQAFIVTEKGIKFYEPVSINNVTLSELYFNEDKTALVSPDANFSSALVPSPLTITNSTVISFEDSKASPYLIEKYEAAKGWAENIFSWGTLSKKVKLAPMAGNEGENATGIEIVETTQDGSGWSGYYLVDFVGVAGAPTQVKFLSKGPQDSKENYLYFFKDPAIWLAEILVRSAPYTVENHSSEYYRLISVGDANVWFLVKK